MASATSRECVNHRLLLCPPRQLPANAKNDHLAGIPFGMLSLFSLTRRAWGRAVLVQHAIAASHVQCECQKLDVWLG